MMLVQLDVSTMMIALGIPTAVTGLCFWALKRNIEKRDDTKDKQEEARKKNELLLIKGVSAAITLGEATAMAVQRLDPDTNGEMKAALNYAKEIKHEQKDFLHQQGVENFF